MYHCYLFSLEVIERVSNGVEVFSTNGQMTCHMSGMSQNGSRQNNECVNKSYSAVLSKKTPRQMDLSHIHLVKSTWKAF